MPAGIHDLETMLYCDHALESGKRVPVTVQVVSVEYGASTPPVLVIPYILNSFSTGQFMHMVNFYT